MLVIRVLLMVLGSAVAVLAIQGLGQSNSYAALVATGNRLVETGRPDPDRLAAAAPDLDRVVAERVCRSEVLDAALQVHLAVLDRQNRTRDPEGWERAFAAFDRFVRHALGCAPANAELWARAAQVSADLQVDPAVVAAYAQQSASLSPAEYPVLVARFAVWRRLGAEGVAPVRDSFRQDVKTILFHARPVHVNELLDRPDAAFIRDEARAQAGLLAADRRAELDGPKYAWLFAPPGSP